MKLNNHTNPKNSRWMILFSVLLIGITAQAWSQNLQDNVTISRSTVDAGGGRSVAGDFVLNGSIGQHDAATTSSGGDFFVAGGFWANASDGHQTTDDLIFANSFETP